MRVLAACLLLSSVLVATNAAKPAPAMFSDWLSQQAAAAPSTAKAAAAPAYEEVDFEWGCLAEKKRANCRCIGCLDSCENSGTCAGAPTCCATNYFESVLTCCEHEAYNEYDRDNAPSLLSGFEIGTCEFTRYLFNTGDEVPVAGTAGVLKVGTFTAVCNIAHGERCEHPFCDSMALTWQGTIYDTPAVSKTQVNNDPTQDDECTVASLFPERKAKKKTAAKPAPQKAKKADAAEASYYPDRDGPAPTFYKGNALLYSGPATISSRKYNLKYRSGFVDYVGSWTNGVPGQVATPAEVASMHHIAPFTYSIKLNKDKHY